MSAKKAAGKGAGKRAIGPEARKSLNLSVRASNHLKFKALALLLGKEPGELMDAWIEKNTAGMRFSMPGLGDEDGRGGDGSDAPGTLPIRQTG